MGITSDRPLLQCREVSDASQKRGRAPTLLRSVANPATRRSGSPAAGRNGVSVWGLLKPLNSSSRLLNLVLRPLRCEKRSEQTVAAKNFVAERRLWHVQRVVSVAACTRRIMRLLVTHTPVSAEVRSGSR
jgi:hypothetical protein